MIRSLLSCLLICLSLSHTPQQFITAPDLEATIFFEGECPPEGCPENNVCNCDASMLGDGICQWECVNFACNWDEGDCCDNWMLYNEFCDAACYLEKFNWDQGACKKPLGKCKCAISELGNGHCNWHCSDHIECLMERGDCCFSFEIGDGRCEEYCYSKENNWDGGDCFKNPPKDCPCYEKGLLGDGVCNKECDTAECIHDFGDCCDEKLLGNGVCDESCNTEVLDFDGGDCLN